MEGEADVSEMVERIAVGIKSALKSVAVSTDSDGTAIYTSGDIDDFTVDGSVDLRLVARAAIAEMREPTREMCEAGQRVNILSEELGRFEFLSCDEMAAAWKAMIDEALRNIPAVKAFNTDPQT